jgi:hypothetical protein
LRSVITPREVETIATPRPFITCGNVVTALVDAQSRDGETRSMRSMTGRARVVLELDLKLGLGPSVAYQ